MTITAAGIQAVLALMEGVWDKIEVVDADGALIDDKVPVLSVETGYLESTIYFAHDEANDTIVEVYLYAGVTKIAGNEVNIIKTSRQSLTIVRRDYLEGE